ncbi:hypothetical protein COHA_009903 [Chlorella ohadii]|uniref:Peptidase S8/S53 domain-containing protein n=1 Tax=Chlorella ohadii TaxID=2649997 RepID=A0AAD5H062_9CHLO|nr:hypothetical protein COHA_009903 [Chlorella ohadii]
MPAAAATRLTPSKHGLAFVQPLSADLGGSGSSGGSSPTGRRLVAVAAHRTGGVPGMYRIVDGAKVPAKLAQLAALPEVEWAVPDYQWELPPLSQPSSTAGSSNSGATTRSGGGPRAAGQRPRRRLAQAPVQPNDPYFANGTQWYLPAVSAPEAWALVSGVDFKQFNICVIDSGMVKGHPDLPTPAAGWNTVPVVDAAGTTILGFPQAGQASFLDYADKNGHGTRVAGILAARTNNGIGVAGLAHQAQLLVCRIYNASTGGFSSSVDRCIDLCLQSKAKVFSMSIGYNMQAETPDAFTQAMFNRIKAAGALVVAAAGNDGRRLNQTNVNRVDWQVPAALAFPDFGFDNVIAVAATMKDTDGSIKLADSSNYDPGFVQLSAPGENVWSTSGSAAQFASSSGTSFAAPQVSAAAAMMWAAAAAAGRTVTYLQIMQALNCGVDVYASLQTKVVTGGQLNVAAAIQAILSNAPCAPRPPPPAPPPPTLQGLDRRPGKFWRFYLNSSWYQLLMDPSITLQDCTDACKSEPRCLFYTYLGYPLGELPDSGSLFTSCNDPKANDPFMAPNCLLWSGEKPAGVLS